ncbi:hypothetical protein AJ79_06843 [Helicocarpus griseus UAMH5409]|uniref:DNA replication regulator Sld3 C-terminal domain-containing protein n=1 Tax=Helicocarpus griseus UAMH5409 TaxID=1447875 RepID=A0A2B7X930_9EURO|nr:hypothetical protein AJ79_06843 [Helicocarpus griseus UAMH5409]
MASYSRPAVLEPASPTLLNALKTSPPPLKRRKTSHDFDVKTTYSSAFTIRPHGSSPSEDPITLIPIALLPRSRLPLSWLDPSPSPTKRIQSGRLFVANVPTLEQDLQQRQHRSEPVVLATRLAADDEHQHRLPKDLGADEEFYVVERVKRGIYAVCALGSWVVEGDLLVAAKRWRDGGSASMRDSRGDDEEVDKRQDWVERAMVPDPVDVGLLGKGKGKVTNVSLAFGSRIGEKVPNFSPETSDLSSVSGLVNPFYEGRAECEAAEEDAQNNSQSADILPGLTSDTPLNSQSRGIENEPTEGKISQSPQEIFDGLRSQYLEALYVSKTSVAYFAKGPLSRARATFQSSNENSLFKAADLSSFYRECILPVKKMDLKYKDSLPEAIQNIPVGMSDDEAPAATTKPRKRKARKPKIGKNALYPEESDMIRKWWKNRSLSEASVPRESSRQEEMKRLIGDLRLRETQLQVLLILETISLESSSSSATRGSSLTETQDGPTTKRSKEKKRQDLNVLLELLVDRLCIWHAVSFGDILPSESASSSTNNEPSGKPADSDKLRDFCTEVIIPFYARRLPDQCKSIGRKLGGPVTISPTRPAVPHSKPGPVAQPGAAVKRTHSQRSQQRTLQRVLTDEKLASRSRAPSLSRSSTAPSIPGLKRESSEQPLLSMIAGARGGIQKPKRVDNREVDLNAVAKQHEVKLKKMNSLLEQKKELDAAINALRKPNRELVAKDIAETAEKRTATGSGSTRKSKHPVRNPFGQGVQVMATPKGLRKKDCVGGGGSITRLCRELTSSNEKAGPSPALSNEIQFIPSSSTRPSRPPEGHNFGSIRARHNSVHETPTKAPARLSRLLNGDFADSGFNSTPVPKQSNNLFKIPKLPETNRPFAQHETSPSALRKTRSYPNLAHGGNTDNSNDNINNPAIVINNSTSSIQETPPRPRSSYLKPPESAPIPSLTRQDDNLQNPEPVIFTTPVKATTAIRSKPDNQHNSSPKAAANVDFTFTVGATPEKSIFDQLGWNDEVDDDEIALP